MDIKEAKEIIRAGFAWGNWTDEQKQAFSVAWDCMNECEEINNQKALHRTQIHKFEAELSNNQKVCITDYGDVKLISINENNDITIAHGELTKEHIEQLKAVVQY